MLHDNHFTHQQTSFPTEMKSEIPTAIPTERPTWFWKQIVKCQTCSEKHNSKLTWNHFKGKCDNDSDKIACLKSALNTEKPLLCGKVCSKTKLSEFDNSSLLSPMIISNERRSNIQLFL